MAAADRTLLITGANSGIGLETTRVLARQGHTIVMACRDRDRSEPVREQLAAETGNERLTLMDLDLASLADVRRFAAEFDERHERLDVLLNNAGCFSMTRRETVDGFELTMGTNHLGPFLLTNLLLPLLRDTPGARVVNVSSDAHYHAKLDLDDLQLTRGYAGFPAYASSKLANVLFTLELARRVAGDGITVNAAHPGHVATNIWPSDRWYWSVIVPLINLFAISAEQGARTSVFLATSEEVAGTTGQYFAKEAVKEPSETARDEELQARMWDISEELTGLGVATTP